MAPARTHEEPALTLDQNEGQPIRGQAVEWLMQLQESPGDERLHAEFDDWLARDARHRGAYEEMASLWGQAERVGALRVNRQRTETASGRVAATGRKRWVLAAGLAIAASLAFITVPRVQLWLAADHQTGVAELRDIVLDDGSRIALDAQTAISVEYTGTQRTVTLLSGQGYFEVTPSRARPFVVKAENVSVRVTGTAFSVGLSDANVAVAVRSGSVNVSEQARGTIADLTAGQQVRLSRAGSIALGDVAADDVAAWRERRLVVYDVPIRQVVEQIARHTKAVVVFADSRIAEQLVTATVDLQHPEEALRTVVGLRYGKVTEMSSYLAVISAR
ncbi:MAG: DUF4880 domain-containing protein [Reyranella sp.]|uniref:FecR family protein n=1 Tax=Reyranella sp. TaxID=1929291 RepID=UPI0012221FAF|nr:FecR domain-containing protein [Reyranella sp.]TAJ88487.1 MAG: DUF4880 domain-containing protein [Reyranella sp.]TBR30285.1 MAG: DUF4880 domain-containing protein [Reyranella sp.]